MAFFPKFRSTSRTEGFIILLIHWMTRSSMPWELSFFTLIWLGSQPKHQGAFNTVMDIQRTNRGEEWFKFYPVEDRLRADSSEPLLVDVRGGLGHDPLVF